MKHSEGTVKVHIFVTGRVQGVYFREFTRRQAVRLGVTGWVKNCPDGRVEAIAEGERSRLDRLIAELRSGPPASRVDDIYIEWEDSSHSFHSFHVLYD